MSPWRGRMQPVIREAPPGERNVYRVDEHQMEPQDDVACSREVALVLVEDATAQARLIESLERANLPAVPGENR